MGQHDYPTNPLKEARDTAKKASQRVRDKMKQYPPREVGRIPVYVETSYGESFHTIQIQLFFNRVWDFPLPVRIVQK